MMRLKRLNLYVLIVSAAMLAAMASSCGSSKHASSRKSSSLGATRTETPRHITFDSDMPQPAHALLREADSWIGTRYRYGGNDRNGVDCSGFVSQVYSRALDIKLPRTSAQQSDFCTDISRGALQVGDLVFFSLNGGSKVGHVGIYVGDGNMIHASSSRGVVITPLSSPYFDSRFVGAGRVDKYYAMVKSGRKTGTGKKPVRKSDRPEAPAVVPETPSAPSVLLAGNTRSEAQPASPASRLRASAIEIPASEAPAVARDMAVSSSSAEPQIAHEADTEECVTMISEFFD